MLCLEAASVLHDIGIKECERKYNNCNGFLQQIEGPSIANEILSNYDLKPETAGRILYLIAHHHTYRNVFGLDYQILLEADLIVNAQEKYITEYAFRNAVARLFATETGKAIADVITSYSIHYTKLYEVGITLRARSLAKTSHWPSGEIASPGQWMSP